MIFPIFSLAFLNNKDLKMRELLLIQIFFQRYPWLEIIPASVEEEMFCDYGLAW